MARVGVVICNFNKKNDVLDCIASVLENKYTDLFIYVVDNASSDGSAMAIMSEYADVPNMMLIVNEENLGGSGGFNTGLRKALEAEHEYLMCVDNDALLDENCVGALVEFLDKEAEAGIAAAKIYHRDDSDYVQQFGSFIDWHNYSVNSVYYNHLEDGTMPEVVYTDAVPACALMIRKSVIDKIGVMPEENFLYWDDTEWCVRCTMAGFQVASVGAAKALHAMGARKEDVNTFPTYYAWRNWVKFFLDHTPKMMLEDMAEMFLKSVFEVNYSCLYRSEPNKSKTVMLALDDALHGVLGKAREGRIFDLENTYQGLKDAVSGKIRVSILANEFPMYAETVAEKILLQMPEVSVEIITDQESVPQRSKDHAIISLCDSIFVISDLSFQYIYVDLDGNVFKDENDALWIVNYPMSKNSFVFAHKPLFLQLAKDMVDMAE